MGKNRTGGILQKMRVIILAAGRGTRFGVSTPKCMVRVGPETVLERLIRQFGDHPVTVVLGHKAQVISGSLYGHDNVTAVVNYSYAATGNLVSLLCAGPLDDDILVIEADCLFDDTAASHILRHCQGRSKVFAAGKASPGRTNGIVRGGPLLSGFQIGEHRGSMDGWANMVGAVFISKCDVASLQSADLETYYFAPLIDRCDVEVSLLPDTAQTHPYNTYASFVAGAMQMGLHPETMLHPMSQPLHHVEDFSQSRVLRIARKMSKEGKWTRPICVSTESIIMDGQHRYEVARMLGLSVIPITIYDYSETEIYSLRDDITFTVRDVTERVLRYPYKTVKHVFPRPVPECCFDLEGLK